MEAIKNSMYIDILPLHQNHSTTLVQNALTGLLYVRKTFTQCEAGVYTALMAAPHPNLAAIHEVTPVGGRIQVLEQYINGITLEAYLHSKRALPENEVLDIASQLTSAMQHLHSLPRPIIHRDIKLSNILRTEGGHIYLCDYNAARFHAAHLDRDTVPLGTEGYAAPEQFGFSQSDARTDIYAFGILLNLLLTGHHPSKQMAQGKLRRVIERCIAFSPQDRFVDVAQLQKALCATRHGGGLKTIRRTALPFLAGAACVTLLYTGLSAVLPAVPTSQQQGSPFFPSSTSQPTPHTTQPVTTSSPFRLGSFEVTFGDLIEWGQVPDIYYDHGMKDVLYLHATVQNISGAPASLSGLSVDQYGPSGTRLKDISLYFEDYIGWAFEVDPGATAEGKYYFLYEGSGEYQLSLTSGGTTIELLFEIE